MYNLIKALLPLVILAGLATGCSASKSGRIVLSPNDNYALTSQKIRKFGEGLAYSDICHQSSSKDIRRLTSWIFTNYPQQADELMTILVDSTVESFTGFVNQVDDQRMLGLRPEMNNPQVQEICRKNKSLYKRLVFPEP